MTYEFRWNDWNVNHIAEHDVTPHEVEHVVEHAGRRNRQPIGDGKYRVRGQSAEGRYL